MKKLILAFMLLASATAFGQLEKKEVPKDISIGKARAGGIKFSELFYAVTQAGDTLYHYSYKDKTFKQLDIWESVFFRGGSKTLDDLYLTLKSALDSSKGTITAFKLGETNITVKTERMIGTKYLLLGIATKAGTVGVTDLTGRQIESLFNKNADE